MSTIRRQSIISSVIVYFGFALGFFNTYLFTREGGLTKEEYGLTGTFIAIANIMFGIASLGMHSYINKFFPYYHSHLPEKKNDQLAWALLIPCIGFTIVLIAGLVFKNILVDKIFDNSPQLLNYYYWIFPFGFGYTIFMVLEAYAWQRRKAVVSNFLKEVVFRLLVTVLIVLTSWHIIKSFNVFIGLYSFTYLAIVIYLVIYLYKNNQFHLNFSVSQVTRKFYKKIVTLVSFIWGGGLIYNIASVFDTIIIAAVLPNGMAAAGIFTLAQNISSLMQAPQRAIISASLGPLSQAWKEKDYKKIDTIYHRSSINQLIFASAMFCLIWLNFEDGIRTFNIQGDFLAAKWVFFFIGIYKIIDMGTGLNAQIIATSTYWRFEFMSGLILFAIIMPLNWQLTRYLGLIGPPISSLVAFTVYNAIRYFFLWNKFKMQPFTWKTLFTILLSGGAYLLCYWLFNDKTGLQWIFLRSSLFILLFAAGMYFLKLSPDAAPVWETIKKKLKPGK
ncbi:MAG TPA: lipopolysaccharide biosynthesis protein [Flavisolibacter sp.]|nr:lipopolysaccharide biosynthesis protein [Flavisolibacter sp.]